MAQECENLWGKKPQIERFFEYLTQHFGGGNGAATGEIRGDAFGGRIFVRYADNI